MKTSIYIKNLQNKKLLFFTFLTFILFFTNEIKAYNPSAAAAYADQWTCDISNASCDPAKHNPAYPYYLSNDCANFVSQCLIAGGLNLSAGPGVASGTIAFCDNLHLHLTQHQNVQYQRMNSSTPSWFVMGDVVMFGDNSNDYWKHSCIAVTSNPALVDAHTNNRYHRPVSFYYPSFTNGDFYHFNTVSLPNDDPCGATQLSVGSNCNLTSGTNEGSTNSSIPTISCDGTSNGDVWFKFQVPSSGHVIINTNAGGINDMGMALYSGANCSSLSRYNNSCYPNGSTYSQYMPYADVNGLTPGTTMWIRLWEFNNNSFGSFSICVYEPCTPPATPTNLTPQPTSCNSVQLSWNGSNGNGITYEVLKNNTSCGYVFGSSGVTTPNNAANLTELSPGIDYYFVVTASNSCGVSSNSNCAHFKASSAPSTPSIYPSNPVTICSGETATFSVQSPEIGVTYYWSDGGTGTSHSVINLNGSIYCWGSNSCGNSANSNIGISNLVNPPSKPLSISGKMILCLGENTTFSTDLIPGATSYSWTLPNGWTGNSTSNSIDVTVGEISGNITVTTNNSCGSSLPFSQYVTVLPNISNTSIGTIAGKNSVCAGAVGTYSILPVIGATNYLWTLPTGTVGTSSTNSINVTFGNVSGEISVVAQNECGFSFTSSTSVKVLPNLNGVSIGSINGNTRVCTGTSQTYSINLVDGATSYSWILPSGSTGSSTTNSITMTFGNISGNISVVANNDCGSSLQSSKSVTIVQDLNGISIGSITGNTSVCSGTSYTYSINPVNGATSYSWQLPNGSTGNSTTNSIIVTFGNTSGNISVVAINDCGYSIQSSKSVTIVPALNGISIGSITGNSNVCSGSSQTYSIIPVYGASSYLWLLPNGCIGNSLTNSITVSIGNNSGSISVFANNVCGSSLSSTLVIDVIPNLNETNIGTIIGNTSICTESTQQYSISSIAGATEYIWTLPNLWTGNSTTKEIVVTSGNSSGTIIVTANNSCSVSLPSTIDVSVQTIPTQPDSIYGYNIVCANDTVTYSIDPVHGTDSYVWVISNGVSIKTDTSYSNIPHDVVWENNLNGKIEVYTQNSCGKSSTRSLNVSIRTIEDCITGISELSDAKDFSIYPNPTNDQITIQNNNSNNETYVIDLINALGQIIIQERQTNFQKTTLNLDKYPVGVYYVILNSSESKKMYKIFKQ